MSSYLNVGAKIGGDWVGTKKVLREVMRDDPSLITFYPTSMFHDPTPFKGDAIPEGRVLSVVGPDPERKRSWYASVKNGRVT